MELISAVRASSAVSTFDFQSIPSTYTHLLLIADCLIDSGNGSGWNLRLNGTSDESSKYDTCAILSNSGSSAAYMYYTGGGYAATANNALIHNSSSNAARSFHKIYFPFYKDAVPLNTNITKNDNNTGGGKHIIGWSQSGYAGSYYGKTLFHHKYYDSANINRIYCYHWGGNKFLEGTTFSLHGF